MQTETDFDAIIVGGGIGGAALAFSLAKAGKRILVLEKSMAYKDRVRGEWIAPWGVIEAQTLGLYDVFMAAGGHHVGRHVSYGDEFESPAEAEAAALPLAALVPGIAGPLCLQHTVACTTLAAAAATAGATVLRGVDDVLVTAGVQPVVRYTHRGGEATASCRLIVGADGRNSVVRGQAGIPIHRGERHHLFSGMLVENAPGWPEDLQTKGTEGDVNYLAFPQGEGRVRLYLGYDYSQKDLLSGKDAQRRFLDAFRLSTLPGSEHLANATAVSHCFSYPNEDTWTDEPFVDGLVLIGDAAGHNDPIIGQGLSITLRDVRMVRDALLGTDVWSDTRSLFTAYATERAERMRRLRFAAEISAVVDSEFGDEACERRKAVAKRRAADPSLMLPTLAVMLGPENAPAFAFTEEMRAKILTG